MFSQFKNKRVLITGHTGFKGAWLTKWLLDIGAQLIGVSLKPDEENFLFNTLDLEKRIDHVECDIRDRYKFTKKVLDSKPDYIFHLAAQSLVRESYVIPAETYETNLMGTVNLLSALKDYQKYLHKVNKTCVSIFITTDKCYDNKEWEHSYREVDPMGGYDPYSSSKGCCELAIDSFRNSFFNLRDSSTGIFIASARAGNVIGGGDWAKDRILPDCIRALKNNESIPIRNPIATRPWQHVLEPLGGYLLLAEKIKEALDLEDSSKLLKLCSSFNFGPELSSNKSVLDLVKEILEHWDGKWNDISDPKSHHEATSLNLAHDRAYHLLGWNPVWNFKETIKHTIEWYQQEDKIKTKNREKILSDFTIKQINNYIKDGQRKF